MTPGTDLAVYERGGSAEKRQDKATRILILGVGVLNGFSRNSFRAVLAHEYGHFSHRDTAGSEVERDVEAAFRESLERKTSEDDTHPAPAERFRLSRRVKTKGEPEADGTVWELFADREALTGEMSEPVSRKLQAA